MKKCLFVCYGGGHVRTLLPVIQMMRQNNIISVLGMTTAASVLEDASISYIGFKNLVTNEIDLSGKELSKTINSPLIEQDEAIAYLGLNYADLELTLGKNEARKAYEKYGRAVFYPIFTMNKLLSQIQPDVVVATSAPRAERAALVAAGQLGIPSVCVADLFCIAESQWVKQKDFGTKICVLSEYVRQFLIDCGRCGDDIIVTGNPMFDRLSDPHLFEKALALKAKMGWQDKKVILFVSQPEPKKNIFNEKEGDPTLPRRTEDKIVSLLDQHPDWVLVIRDHPNEPGVLRKPRERVEIDDRKESLSVLLKAVDVVVVLTSTVGIEAALLNKPVISLEMSVFKETAPYSHMGISLGVQDLNDLKDALIKVFLGNFKSNARLPDIGKSTKNVAHVIESVLAQTA